MEFQSDVTIVEIALSTEATPTRVATRCQYPSDS